MVKINIFIIFTKFLQNQLFTKILEFSEFLDFDDFLRFGGLDQENYCIIPWHQVKVLPLGRKMEKFTEINEI